MSPKIVLIPFYNANWQLFTYFYSESSHFLAISSLKESDFLQATVIFKLLKNRELQIRKIRNRKLQALPVQTFYTVILVFIVSISINCAHICRHCIVYTFAPVNCWFHSYRTAFTNIIFHTNIIFITNIIFTTNTIFNNLIWLTGYAGFLNLNVSSITLTDIVITDILISLYAVIW